MKKWLMLFSAMILLVPTSTLASGDGNSHTSDSSPIISQQQQTLTLEAKYKFLKEKGILKGKADGKAQFDAQLSRAELAVSLYRLLKLEKADAKGAKAFIDTKKHWANNEILAVTKKGLMEADKGNKFNPNKKVTIEEVAKVLVKATELDVSNYASIWLPASDWAQGYMAAVLAEGFLPGEKDYTSVAKRSHLVYSLYEVYQHLEPSGIVAGTLEPKLAVTNVADHQYKWTFTVKNQTEREQIVNISGSQFDYILKKDGKKVEQYTENKKFIMIYKEKTLKQGEELTYTGELNNLEKGHYELEIWLTDSNWPNAKTKLEFDVK